jgi:predicted nucleic acid-binding protein
VFDTTLLTCVDAVGLADLMPLVFSKVRIPTEVRAEIGKGPGKARKRLRRLIQASGGFFVYCEEREQFQFDWLRTSLDLGEAAVIAQAEATGAVAVIDEKKGSKQARDMGVEVLRTGRLLCMMKEAGAITAVAPLVVRLRAEGFALSERAVADILGMAGES